MKYFSARRLRGLLCTLSLIVAAHAVRADVQQRSAAPATPRGTGVIAGTVTAGDSGRALRRVRVTLTNAANNATAGQATTDLSGRFEFSGLADASYLVKAQRIGFLEVVYGQKKPGSGKPGLAIPLTTGQRVDNLALQLPRGGVIAGTITDEAGDPAMSVTVRAMKYVLHDGEPQFSSGGIATTDDRGNYRVGMLPPGEYVIAAAPRDELLQAALLAEQLAARGQQVVAARANAANMSRDEAAALQARTTAAMGPPPEMPREAYVQVYFPGTLQMTSATHVTIDVSEERSAVDFQLQIVPIANVSGRVSWSGGRLPTGNSASDTSLVLSDKSGLPGGGTDKYLHAPASGQFSFANVPAGEYTLWAQAHVPMPSAPGATPGATTGPATQVPVWASMDLTVTGQPVTNLRLALEPGFSISGRVVVEGGTYDLARIRIRPQPAGYMLGEIALMEVPLGSDGRFTVHGLIPGRYRFIASTAAQDTIPMRSSMFGGRDTLDFPLEVAPGVPLPEGVITVVPRLGEIAGQLQNQFNQPVTAFTVVAFPTDQRFWTPLSRRIQAVRPSADGRYSVKNLPAGDYRIVAVTDVATGQWFDPAFLREINAHPAATNVTLTDGERREQILRAGG